MHLHFKAGEVPYYPKDKDDDTHISLKGANEITGIVVNKIQLLNDPSV